MVIIKIVGVLIFLFLAGVAKGVTDTILFRYKNSVFQNKNPLFWNHLKSWRNKYKGGDPDLGEKFPGSTTIFVFLTDAFHLFEFFRFASVRGAVVLAASIFFPLLWWQGLAAWVILLIPRSLGFHLFYSLIARRKEVNN